MAFMVPEYFNGRMLRAENSRGESELFPADMPHEAIDYALGPNRVWDESEQAFVETQEGWFCRLSAPGYTDCTEWSGPFLTLSLAKAEIARVFEVDPDTGDELS